MSAPDASARPALTILAAFTFGLALAVHRGRIPGYVDLYRAPLARLDQLIIWTIVALVCVWLLRRTSPRRAISNFCLTRPPLRPLLFAAISALPMFIASAATGAWRLSAPDETIASLLAILWLGAIVAPFAEEIFFRGFAFGELVRTARWGFWPAAIVTGLIFGAVHFFGAIGRESLAGALGVVAITAVGGAWYAWLYLRWNFNLWVPIFLHALMNAPWILFVVDDTALGTWTANAGRAGTIAIATLLTLFGARSRWLRPLAPPNAAPTVPAS
ncbi:MAG: CPBP family intramembrane glutamic endopeptidase [Phycisphaerales bacterium JB039]